MRRAIFGSGIAVFAICIVISAGRWTTAQDSNQGVTPLNQSGEGAEESTLTDLDSSATAHDWDSHDEEQPRDEHWDEEEEYSIEEDLLELELIAAHCEHTSMLSEMCEDHAQTLSWVLSEIHEYLDEEEAIALLEQILSKVEEPSVRRLIRLKLVELYSELDQMEHIKEQLHQLILDR